MGCYNSKEVRSDGPAISIAANRPHHIPDLSTPRATNEPKTLPPEQSSATPGPSTGEVVPYSESVDPRIDVENDSDEGLSPESAAYIREITRQARERGETSIIDLRPHVESGDIRQEELDAAAAAQLCKRHMKSSGLELQVALDSLFTGNSEQQLLELLARENGVDPARAGLVLKPWDGSEKDLQPSQHKRVTKIEGGFDEVSGAQKKWEALHRQRKDLAENHYKDKNKDMYEVEAPPDPRPKSQRVFQLLILEYKYAHLDHSRKQIRLLMCTPSKDDIGHAELKLQSFDLEDTPEFYALSYVWGTEGLQVGITCDGRKMSLTRTLARALQRIIPWSQGVPLWADAICINQNDIAERNHQVGIIGDIYRRATQVLAHLGQPTHEIDDSKHDWSAMSLMSYFNKIWHVDKTLKARSEKEWAKLGIPNASDTEVWTRLVDFWIQPWFRRCWVLQEAALGREVVVFYGNAIKNLSTIIQFLDHAQHQDLPSVLKYGHLADVYMMGQKLAHASAVGLLRESSECTQGSDAERHKPFPKSLLNLLILSRSNAVTDPRDKVYGLLGLAEDDVAKSIKPDYSPNNSATNLYIQIAKTCIQNGDGIQLLQHAGIDSVESAAFRLRAGIADPVTDLPSWVPDWSQKPRHNFDHELYSCTRSTEPRIQLTDQLGELMVRGAIIDTVKMESIPLRYSVLSSQCPKYHYYKRMGPGFAFPGGTTDVEACRGVYSMAIVLCDKYCSNDIYPHHGGDLTLVGRTLIADSMQFAQRATSDTLNPSGTAYHRWAKWADTVPDCDAEGGPAEFLKQHDDNLSQDRMVDDAWPFAAALQRTQRGRRLCWTERGYVGTATYDTEEGDLIVLFEGFRMPFVLRRKDDKFQIVGDCYVHGIMDGELMCIAENPDESPPDRLCISKDMTKYCIRLSEESIATFQDFVIV